MHDGELGSDNAPNPTTAPTQKVERKALRPGMPKCPNGLRSIHLAMMAVAMSTANIPKNSFMKARPGGSGDLGFTLGKMS